MRLDLLSDVVKALEIVPENQFEMGFWAHCAIGHYLKQNPNIGLKRVASLRGRQNTGGEHTYWRFTLNNKNVYPNVDSNGCDNDYIVIAKYFKITPKQSEYLFDYRAYKHKYKTTKSQVIGRILKFIEKHSPKCENQHVNCVQKKETVTI